ncbi:MAG TPA: hypothetical protein VJ965_06115 [Anaerolineales bacterium]|nr:hypothetical protein [Anaerolineales bacterium]
MAEPMEAAVLPDKKSVPRPSWIDRWIEGIDYLRMPAWLFYLLAVLALTLVFELSLWIDGTVPFGTYGMPPAVFPPIFLIFLVLYHYLTRVSSQTLQSFSPLLDVSEEELARIETRFLILPHRIGWLLMAVSVPMAFPFVWGGPATWGDLLPNTQLPYLVLLLIIVPFNYTFACLLGRSFRQIKMIGELHAQVTKINLMKLEPAHAFSKLTSRTGIGLFLIVLFGFFYNPNSINSSWSIFNYIGVVSISLVIFIVPVIGIRSKLQEQKRNELYRMEDLIRITNDSLHQKIENSNFDDLGGIQSALNMLTRERDQIESVSTWPWNPGTIRGFTSTLILPIFFRYLYQFLDTLF